jgi:Fe-S-cluster containining protein
MAEQAPGQPRGDVVVATLDVKVAGRAMRIEIPVPTEPVPGAVLIPIARALAAAIGERVLEVVAAEGRAVSCRMGCGACCRQLVPLPIAEARAIHALVARMPEPRRSEIVRRFEAIRDALEAAGLRDLVASAATLAPDAARALSFRYFALGLPCPFLDEESCSIHPDRPVACREYLVTSPAAFCADPAGGKVEGVPRPVRINEAMIAVDPESPPEKACVALSTALNWVERHPAPAPEVPGPQLLQRFLTELFGPGAAGPGQASGGGATTPGRAR